MISFIRGRVLTGLVLTSIMMSGAFFTYKSYPALERHINHFLQRAEDYISDRYNRVSGWMGYGWHHYWHSSHPYYVVYAPPSSSSGPGSRMISRAPDTADRAVDIDQPGLQQLPAEILASSHSRMRTYQKHLNLL